jgi:hypothetical protein
MIPFTTPSWHRRLRMTGTEPHAPSPRGTAGRGTNWDCGPSRHASARATPEMHGAVTVLVRSGTVGRGLNRDHRPCTGRGSYASTHAHLGTAAAPAASLIIGILGIAGCAASGELLDSGRSAPGPAERELSLEASTHAHLGTAGRETILGIAGRERAGGGGELPLFRNIQKWHPKIIVDAPRALSDSAMVRQWSRSKYSLPNLGCGGLCTRPASPAGITAPQGACSVFESLSASQNFLLRVVPVSARPAPVVKQRDENQTKGRE